MNVRDDDLRIRLGRIRNRGSQPKTFVAQVLKAAQKAGHIGPRLARGRGWKRRSTFGRGRGVALASTRLLDPSRRVVVKARVVRHRGRAFRSAPLSAHIAYLKREGVTKDSDNGDTSDDGALSRQLTYMSRQLESLDRDLRVVSETVALHARYHLTIAPPLPVAELRPACVLGRDRFEVFAAQVERHVRSGTSLMREAMDRATAAKPDSFTHDPQEPAPFGVHFAGDEPSVGTTIAADEPSELCAAAREDGRNGGFRRSRIPLR